MINEKRQLAGILLPAKGGIFRSADPSHSVVYWPIGGRAYAFCDSEGRRLAYPRKDGKRWIVDEASPFIVESPLEKTGEALTLPLSWWQDWAAGKISEPTGPEVFKHVVHALKVFHDLPSEGDVVNQAVWVCSSYARFWLSSFPRLDVAGAKGRGKTAMLETCAALALGGRSAGDLSAASWAWGQKNENVALAIDEIDSLLSRGKHGSDESATALAQMARQGYRPGQYYRRMKQDSEEPDAVPVDGPLAYSRVREIEPMLASRSLTSELAKSTDKRLPVLNSAGRKLRLLLSVKAELMAWWMAQWANPLQLAQNADELAPSEWPRLDFESTPEADRQASYLREVAGFSTDERAFWETFTGRTSELALAVVETGRVLGLQANDYAELREALASKQDAESQPPEGLPGDLIVLLRELFQPADGLPKTELVQKDVFEQLKAKTGAELRTQAQKSLWREAELPLDCLTRKGSGRVITLTAKLKALLYPELEKPPVSNVPNMANTSNIEDAPLLKATMPNMSNMSIMSNVKGGANPEQDKSHPSNDSTHSTDSTLSTSNPESEPPKDSTYSADSTYSTPKLNLIDMRGDRAEVADV